jgi:hypothetical protein
MAQKTVVQLIDDLDGTSNDTIETVTFALDGVTYEIDLGQNNATRLRDNIATFVNAATRTGGRLKRGLGGIAANGSTSASGTTGAADSSREQARTIREWARDNDYDISDRGRIPAAVVEAYQASVSKPKTRTKR